MGVETTALNLSILVQSAMISSFSLYNNNLAQRLLELEISLHCIFSLL